MSESSSPRSLEDGLAAVAELITAAGPFETATSTRDEQLALILTYLGEWLTAVAEHSLIHEPPPGLGRDWRFRSTVVALVGKHSGGRSRQTCVEDLLIPYFYRCGGTWSELLDAVVRHPLDREPSV